MALFPAYASTSSNPPAEESLQTSESWLKNSSFVCLDSTAVLTKEISNKSKKNKAEPHVVKRRKKHKKHKQQEAVVEDLNVVTADEQFKIDTKPNKEFLSVNTISRPAVPKYFKYFVKEHYRNRKRKYKRYFKIFHEDAENEKSDNEQILTKDDLNKEIPIVRNENSKTFKHETDLSETTAYYNRNLNENPKDIDMWLKYVEFQNVVFQFEKMYRKGSIAKGLRIKAERKLSIIDKALTLNPDCESLLREKLNICVNVYAADELQILMKKLVEKDQSNIILWQGYIEATQCTMSHCNTPSVLKLYTKCLSTLHHLRRNSVLEKSILEEYILKMLYQCGLFLKQAGLFEQLWTLLRLYLELNLAPADKNKFNVGIETNEKQLLDLEEVVLKSQLPIHELWLRIEKLRESCHWLPYPLDDCEDPQRLVFPEDVAELIHPITMPGNLLKLTATILTLLKVPLLPCRHTTMKVLGLDYVPWALDSVENLLPIFLPLYPVDLSNKNLLKDTQRLAVGPQYLKTLPGQEEYLEFVLAIMRNCIDCLNGSDKIAITLWWFKFQRLLVVLDKENRFKMPISFKKKIKTSMKNLMKQNEYRNNVTCYQEFALFEYELGNFDSAINILITAITMSANEKDISQIFDEHEKAVNCSLYRTLVEVCMRKNSAENSQKALKYLICLTLGKDIKTGVEFLTQETINEARLKFKHVTLLLMQKEMKQLTLVDHFLPDFFTDWIICNGWFLYITKGVVECGSYIDDILTQLDERQMENCWRAEVLSEFYSIVIFKSCTENIGTGMFKLLDDVLYRSIKRFPNNLLLLTVLAKEQSINCCLGQPWWRLNTLLMKTGHAIPILFLILIANQRSVEIEEKWVDTITGRTFSLEDNFKNRMRALFKKLTLSDMCTRRCGLVWRLYLQFLHTNYDLNLCRKAYYAAVEECPWLKALYMDAAIYIPAELPQIQDLLIEKQLRLHVTPEELDVLRN